MRTVEVRDLQDEELHDKLAELREELFNLRFQMATGQLDNHRRIGQLKRDMARVKTVLREREIETYLEHERAMASAAPSAGAAAAPADAATAGPQEDESQ